MADNEILDEFPDFAGAVRTNRIVNQCNTGVRNLVISHALLTVFP
ncbi:hypothetical protein FACS1894147_01940 [Spirochaetia bacterium]|nr:hypothetical protein FACS1894147_01940 [Spirochaetia bacterium]